MFVLRTGRMLSSSLISRFDHSLFTCFCLWFAASSGILARRSWGRQAGTFLGEMTMQRQVGNQCPKSLGTLEMNLVFSFWLNLKQAVKGGGVALGAKYAPAMQAAASKWEHQRTFANHLRKCKCSFFKIGIQKTKVKFSSN